MTIYTFSDCQKVISLQLQRGFDKKKLANNTYLRKISEEEYAIALHQTDVITILERNNQTVYRLNSGGYQTVTTKDRLNSFSPARIYQKRGVWYLNEDCYSGDGKTDVVYFDGIEIDGAGKVINKDLAPLDLIEKKKILDRAINEYIRGFAKDALENGLGQPGNGDCLICRVYAGEADKDELGHIVWHIAENYYTRTFLYYCLKLRAYNNPGIVWAMIQRDCEQGRDEMLKRELRYAFGKLESRLMQVFDVDEFNGIRQERREAKELQMA